MFVYQGCTANVAFIDHDKKLLYVANSGDARCIIGKKGKVTQISKDHVPEDLIELKRIYAAGKSVWGGRIMGNLNLSRALGDHRYKDTDNLPQEEQAITANPDTYVECLEDVDFLLLGCDGIFEKFSNDEIGEFIYKNKHKEPQVILREFLSQNVAEADLSNVRGGPNSSRGTDNQTGILLIF
jgi:serine/threonine protein phosphatase PrpC